MPITVQDFASLTDDLQKIFNEGARRKIATNAGFQIFNTFDTNRRTYDHLILHGVSGIKRVTPGEDLPKINTQEGDTITFTQEYFGAVADITKEMRKFDLHNQITQVIKTLVDSAFDDVDQSFADRLIQGWDTSYTDVYGDTVSAVGPDGLALFSASHTNPVEASVTYSNIITDGTNTNPYLSRAAIVHWRSLGKVHKDPNGKTRPINYDSIIVTPHNEDLVDRICNSEFLPGTGNNDKNPLKGQIKNIHVWERSQTASDATDAKEYWYMYDSSQKDETLMGLFSERPGLDAPEQVYVNKNWEYSCDFFYTIGTGYQAYVAGSKGDES